jgi:hypothetical protein
MEGNICVTSRKLKKLFLALKLNLVTPYPARQENNTDKNTDDNTIIMLFLKYVRNGYSLHNLEYASSDGLSGIHFGGIDMVSDSIFKDVDNIQRIGISTTIEAITKTV